MGMTRTYEETARKGRAKAAIAREQEQIVSLLRSGHRVRRSEFPIAINGAISCVFWFLHSTTPSECRRPTVYEIIIYKHRKEMR